MPRLNKVIEVMEQGKVAFVPLGTAGSIGEAQWFADSPYDGVIYDMEHNPYNPETLRLTLQFMLSRRQIAERGIAPAVAPMVRIPVNGRENNNWIIKQVLDIGVFGILLPMINTPDDALSALMAARYIQAQGAPDRLPVGRRGHSPNIAVRYWGVSQPEYFAKADVWPLDPAGEILLMMQCETQESVKNLRDILRAMPKPGLILISEGDLSVSLGYGGDPHAEVDAAVQEAAQICREFGVPYGSPQVSMANIEQRIADGFSMLNLPMRDMALYRRAMELAGRA
ncbi:MAG: aldolase [Chloroflexi bacterium]|nr:aldolase [Chloroflexota bacterium]